MSDLNDGWEADDDLDLSDTDDVGVPSPSDDNLDAANDGWDDSDPFGDDTFGDTPSKETPERRNASHAASPQNEGWDDDDELNLDDSWGDDQGDSTPNLADNNTDVTKIQMADPPTQQDQIAEEASGWEDDDDLFGGKDDEQQGPTTDVNPQPTNPRGQQIVDDLCNYVSSLDRILSSINAVLEFEYNTPQKAQELIDYYVSRKGLAEYTRTKELPRMDYQVVLPDGSVETDKQQIAAHFLPDHSLIARCANQSLLADLLHVLTGPDLVVRPQFLAICVATSCQFTLHLGDEGRDMVQCNSQLRLSLPMPEGPRLDVATVHTSIVFAPQQPLIEFRVHKIDVDRPLDDAFQQALAQVADFLIMMEGHFDELPGHEDVALQNAPADIFRDAFLDNSQKLVAQSTAGMKSALQQMESVVNLKSKFKIVKGGISKFLPATDQLLAAEEEARALANSRKPPQGMPKPAPPPNAPPGDASRPKSILGGLVTSGWTALSKSVAIPDEAELANQPPQVPPQPLLYRKDQESPLKLYRPNNSGQPRPPSPPPRQHQLPVSQGEDVAADMDPNKDSKAEVPSPPGDTKPPVPQHPPEQAPVVARTSSKDTPEETPQPLPAVSEAPLSDTAQVEDDKKETSLEFGEGWDDIDDVDVVESVEAENNITPAVSEDVAEAQAAVERQRPPPRQLIVDVPYNPEDDIIETRKRWVNPRPNRPYVIY